MQATITWLSFELWYAVPQPDVAPAQIIQPFEKRLMIQLVLQVAP